MVFRLANTIANIKLGLKTKRLSITAYPNKFIKRVLRKLTEEGILRGFSVDLVNNKLIRIYLKYDEQFSPIIKDLKLISTSGKRKFFKYKEILEVYARGEIYLISTTKGLFTVMKLFIIIYKLVVKLFYVYITINYI